MASSRITPRQWEELKPKIQDLVHRGCPLKCKDGSRQTISEILQQDLNISITVAQLEPKLRKWGVAKNLKLHEWREIMPRLDEFEASGTSYRILLANHKIPQPAVQGARKRLGSENLTAEQRSQETLHNSQTRTISIVDSSGQVLWSSIAESPQQPHTNVDLGQDDGIDAVLEDATMSESLTTSKQGFPADFLLQTALSLSLQNPINLPGVTESDAFYGLLESWCSPTTSALQNSVQQPHQSLILRSGQTDLTLLPSRALEAAQVFLRRMLQHAVISHDDTTSPAVTAQEDPAQQPQDPSSEQVDELLDRLLSLLPRKDVEAIQNDASVKDDPGSLVRKLLLCSVINNFAGLEDIPHSAVLAMLKTDPHMRSELFGHLQVSSPALAKTVANTLFRAALETCDVEAAEAIIEASKEKPYAIVPDSMVYECKLERGRNHDSHQACAMEMAVCSGSLLMVHTLLRLNVDVNKTYQSSFRSQNQRGPLWLAICESPLVNMELVEVLLDRGAKFRLEHVLHAMELHVPRLLETLLQQMPSQEHEILLSGRALFSLDPVAHYSNSDATTVIRLFLDKCDESGCGNCNYNYSYSLVQAAKRGNMELFELLRDRRKLDITGGVLSAAIRSRKQSLIELLLQEIEHRKDGPLLSYINAERIDYRLNCPCATTPPAKDQYYSRIELSTTPLAEAIRAQDDELIQVLENLGAYAPILESSPTGAEHVEAATCAAAEVGNLVFLIRLLADATPRSIKALCPALCTAIRWGNAEAVSIILSWLFRVAVLGVNIFEGWAWRTHDPLMEALRAKEEQLVYTLLDLGIFILRERGSKEESYLELAFLWKNDSLIRDMLLMGFRCSRGYRTTPLIEAVRSKNKGLVELLLAHGADIDGTPEKSQISPLGQAVLVADQEMTQLLHFNGAKMTSEEFFQAFSSRGPVHDLLFTIFYSCVHSDPELGPIALKKALELGDLGMLKKLLSAGINPNILTEDISESEYQDAEYTTPLGFAVRHSVDHSLIRALYAHGADINLWAMRHEEKSWTALLLAIEQRNLAMINLLLGLGADIDLPAKLLLRRTPLQAACEIGSTTIVRLLLGKGADVNAPPARMEGGSALRLAAQGGFVGIAELLLSRGAKLIQDQRLEDMTALEAAAYKGRIHMLKLLWKAGKGEFSVDEIDRATAHAENQGHQACADLLGILRSMHVSAAKGLQEASHDRA
ncbi:hypothetical protein MCOR34_006816 [Pyricularia oryzae]|nr:hypothetical protein MCOR34_006816 [Pyricularia oryzae]KAI6500876.1 hypothetical protein MCOR13_005819 [Pyricularia oryzae]